MVVASSAQMLDVLKGTETNGASIVILAGSGADIRADNEYIAFVSAKGTRGYQPVSDRAMANISKGFVLGIWNRREGLELAIKGEPVERVYNSIRVLLDTDPSGQE